MANNKIGLAFFAADTDRFHDVRIKRLKKDMGCSGFAVYEYLLNEIYRVKGCYLPWNANLCSEVSEYWSLRETKVLGIVRFCCSIGLFDRRLFSEKSILTSASIQRSYADMCLRYRRKINLPREYNIMPARSEVQNAAFCPQNAEDYTQNVAFCPQNAAFSPQNVAFSPQNAEDYPQNAAFSPQNATFCPQNATFSPQNAAFSPPLYYYDDNINKKKKEIYTKKKEENFPRGNPSVPSVDDEVRALAREEAWLDSLQVLHHLPKDKIIARMPEFVAQCKADGLQSHDTLQEAKRHFNNWLRVVTEKERRNGTNNNRHTELPSEAGPRKKLRSTI